MAHQNTCFCQEGPVTVRVARIHPGSDSGQLPVSIHGPKSRSCGRGPFFERPPRPARLENDSRFSKFSVCPLRFQSLGFPRPIHVHVRRLVGIMLPLEFVGDLQTPVSSRFIRKGRCPAGTCWAAWLYHWKNAAAPPREPQTEGLAQPEKLTDSWPGRAAKNTHNSRAQKASGRPS